MNDARHRRSQTVPPLAAEDHVCAACGLSYAAVEIDEAVRRVRGIPDQVRDAALEVPPAARTRRPESDVWSVVEYVCHLRDVYATSTIRLHRTRTEERPVLEPMLNDLRARRFRYNERDLSAVLDELAANVSGFCEEVDHMTPSDWERTATRLTGEHRTARWLVRQALHEGIHHVRDIATVGRSVAPSPAGEHRDAERPRRPDSWGIRG